MGKNNSSGEGSGINRIVREHSSEARIFKPRST